MLPPALAALSALPDLHLDPDLFGCLAAARSVAVRRVPRNGHHAPDPYAPGATLESSRRCCAHEAVNACGRAE